MKKILTVAAVAAVVLAMLALPAMAADNAGVAVAAVVLAMLALPAMAADNAGVQVVYTTTITNNATATLPATSGWAKIDNCARPVISVKFTGNGASTSNIITRWARSMDGSTYETSLSSSLAFTNVMNGTTAVVGLFQLDPLTVGGCHSLKLVSVQCDHATVSATNVSIGVGKKRGF